MNKDTILLIGASGQIGTDLTLNLRAIYGTAHVVASDIKSASLEVMESGPFEQLDIMDSARLNEIVDKYKVTQIYLLAALLSATAEKNIELGWDLNMRSLSHVLDLARYGKIKKSLLAKFNCSFWSYYAKRKHTTIHYNGTQYCIRYF